MSYLKKAGLDGSVGFGISELLEAISFRRSSMAALSVMTSQEGRIIVGTCPSGFKCPITLLC